MVWYTEGKHDDRDRRGTRGRREQTVGESLTPFPTKIARECDDESP